MLYWSAAAAQKKVRMSCNAPGLKAFTAAWQMKPKILTMTAVAMWAAISKWSTFIHHYPNPIHYQCYYLLLSETYQWPHQISSRLNMFFRFSRGKYCTTHKAQILYPVTISKRAAHSPSISAYLGLMAAQIRIPAFPTLRARGSEGAGKQNRSHSVVVQTTGLPAINAVPCLHCKRRPRATMPFARRLECDDVPVCVQLGAGVYLMSRAAEDSLGQCQLRRSHPTLPELGPIAPVP